MRKSIVPGGILVSLLAGCSGEPSEAELEKAVKVIAKAELDRAQATFKQLGNNPYAKDLAKSFEVDLSKVSVKKLACAKAEGNPGYNCDVEVSKPGEGTAEPQKSPLKGRFVKSDDGWVMMPMPFGR